MGRPSKSLTCLASAFTWLGPVMTAAPSLLTVALARASAAAPTSLPTATAATSAAFFGGSAADLDVADLLVAESCFVCCSSFRLSRCFCFFAERGITVHLFSESCTAITAIASLSNPSKPTLAKFWQGSMAQP